RTQAIAAARANANYYLETCSTFRQPGVVERLVAEAGADRVIFGSDTPLMDPRPQLGKIVTADIDAAAKRLILGGNARRLLRL
ncbi:MAG: amidohydrolase family protein, partial [Gemmatimonadetes bacterium]|nr:amidohydrolase family protein [Gemmatimonadota bacterium]